MSQMFDMSIYFLLSSLSLSEITPDQWNIVLLYNTKLLERSASNITLYFTRFVYFEKHIGERMSLLISSLEQCCRCKQNKLVFGDYKSQQLSPVWLTVITDRFAYLWWHVSCFFFKIKIKMKYGWMFALSCFHLQSFIQSNNMHGVIWWHAVFICLSSLS